MRWCFLFYLLLNFPQIILPQASKQIEKPLAPSCFIKNNILYFSYGIENGRRDYDSILTVRAGYSEPSVAIDSSASEFKNRIYVSWSDKKNGKKNDDVFLVFSDDLGKNWTEPVLVAYHPNHKPQYSPEIKIDKQGKVYLLFIDCKNYYLPGQCDITLGVSENGGLKFSEYRLNARPLKMNQIKNYYFDQSGDSVVVSLKGGDHAYALTPKTHAMVKELQIEKSFVWGESLFINFISTESLKISASLTKPLDPSFEKVLFTEKKFKPGSNKFLVSFSEKKLNKETYILNLYYKNRTEYVWIIPDQ